MTLARLVCLTLALGPAACASRSASHATTPAPAAAPHESSSYELCKDPQFECVPAEIMPERVDTNLAPAMPSRTLG